MTRSTTGGSPSGATPSTTGGRSVPTGRTRASRSARSAASPTRSASWAAAGTPFELPSTYPFRTVLSRAGEGEWDIFAKGTTRLGNDVWVGRGAMILSGSQIGHGAVIGAGAVVAGKTIPPYAIVAGNPGTIIGSRFDEATIERMLGVRWWDWPDELIQEMEPFFSSATDVFLEEAERLNAAIDAAAAGRASAAARAA